MIERITKNLTRFPETPVRLVKTMAAMLLLVVFVSPFEHARLGRMLRGACRGVILADLVITDADNHFGEYAT